MINDIQIKQWTSKLLQKLSVSHTEYANFEFPRHFHTYYTILLVEEGVNLGFTGRHKYTIGPGSILLINPGEIHAGKSYAKKYLKFSSIKIEEDFLYQLLTNNGIDLKTDILFYNKPINDPDLSRKMKVVLDSITNCQERNLMDHCLTEFIFDLIEGHSLNASHFKDETLDFLYLKKAREFIQDNYQQNISLTNIAQACYVSEYHLSRQFQRHFGLSPFAYIRNYRVEKARQLLQEKENITEVALSVGFYDHSHFLKNFKKLMGMRPSQYQKAFHS